MTTSDSEPRKESGSPSQPRWLDEKQAEVWLDVWSLMTWLPARLDNQLRRDSGLSHSEYHALSQISMAPQRTMRLSELAEVSNMTLSHLSRVISRLEKSDWVRRVPAADDGRTTLAELTEEGWQKVKESAPGHVEAVLQHVFDPLTPQQIDDLGAAAARIVDVVNPPTKPRA